MYISRRGDCDGKKGEKARHGSIPTPAKGEIKGEREKMIAEATRATEGPRGSQDSIGHRKTKPV